MKSRIFVISALALILPVFGQSSNEGFQTRRWDPVTQTWVPVFPKADAVQIQGIPVGTEIPQNGHILQFNGLYWQSMFPNFSLGGDLSGTTQNASVNRIRSVPVAPGLPGNGQYLRYDGSQWAPATLPANIRQAGFTFFDTSTLVASEYNVEAIFSNRTGKNWTPVLFWCSVDSGTANVNIAFKPDSGSYSNILASDAVCSTTPVQISTFAVGSFPNGEFKSVVSSVSGAKRISVILVYNQDW